MLKPDGAAFLKFLEQFRRASIRARPAIIRRLSLRLESHESTD
jgi:hypothetical protein